MSLTFHYHPLSSFCHKVLLALYENETPFEGRIVDLGDAGSRAALCSLWPLGKIPILHDAARDRTVPETTIILEYLARHYPGPVPLVPEDPELALEARLWDRFFDLYVSVPVQTIVGDRLRPADRRDPLGVEGARGTLRTAYDLLEEKLDGRTFAAGEAFTIADCAAAPALFYADIVNPFSETHPRVAAYFERLLVRPAFVRVLEEARPYFALFPLRDRIPRRFLGDAT